MCTAKVLQRCRGGPKCDHRVTAIHYDDSVRRSQVKRFAKLQVQTCDVEAYQLWEMINQQVAQMEEHVRIDVPSVRAISRVLGFLRTGAMLKDGPMLVIEMTAQEIARAVRYSRSQVEVVLRWVGVGDIFYHGEKVGVGLGVITRKLRKGVVTVCGQLRGVYRASLMGLTTLGRKLLGLDVEKAKSKSAACGAKVRTSRLTRTQREAHSDAPAARDNAGSTRARVEVRADKREARVNDRRRAMAAIGRGLKAFFDGRPDVVRAERLTDDGLTQIQREYMERVRRFLPGAV